MHLPITNLNYFSSTELIIKIMRQYKFYFIIGLMFHLIIVFVIITQPSTDGEFHDIPPEIFMQKYQLNEEVSSQVLSKRSLDNLVSEELLNNIYKLNEHNQQVPGQFRQIQGIYVYGSYIDHRLDGDPMVRILALQKLKDLDNLVCLFQEDEKFYLTYTEKYEMCENHGKVYGGYIYSCSIPKHITGIPDQVTLTILADDEPRETNYHTFNLFPLNNHSNDSRDAVGVCLPPLFGEISSSKIIQFIELAKILNASNFFVYKFNVSKNTETLLSYYSVIGDVVVTKWQLPETIQDHEIWNKGQLLAIQDCLYSHMNRFKYLLFIDWDEMLIPRTRFTWSEMLRNIENQYKFKTAGFSFQSVFFDPKYQSNMDRSIQFLQHQERTVATSDVRSKVIVRPERVFEVGIHHLSRSLDNMFKSVNIDPELALIHHYRPCVSNFDQTMKCYPTMADDVIMTYANRLTDQVQNTQNIMSLIYSHFQNRPHFENVTTDD